MSHKKMKLIYSVSLFFVTVLFGALLAFSYSSKKVLANDISTSSSSQIFKEENSSHSTNTDNLEDDDRNIVGKFELSSKSDTYLTGSEVEAALEIEINQTVNPSNLEIRIPNDYLTGEPRASTISLTSNPPSVILDTNTNEYVIKYEIPLITGGYKVTIPFSFKVKNHVTPHNYKLKTTANLTTISGDELAQTDATATFTTLEPKVAKYVKNNASNFSNSNNLQIIIGEEDPDNPGYTYDETHLDKLQPIQYKFYHSQSYSALGTRNYEFWNIVDKLPPDALFRQEDNPDWEYDEINHTASYTGPTGLSATSGDTVYSPPVTLYFPSHSLDSNVRITNNGETELIPYFPAENEVTKTSSSSIYHRVAPFKIPTAPMALTKSGSSIYDVITDKINKDIIWNVTFSNPANILNENMTDIEMRDFKLDERLKFTSISLYSLYLGMKGSLTIIGVLEDGTETIITDNYEVTSTSSSRAEEVPIADNVKELIIKTNEGTVLEPPLTTSSRSVTVVIKSKIRDPENTNLPDLVDKELMYNSVQATGRYEDSGNTWDTGEKKGTTNFLRIKSTLHSNKSRQGGNQILYVGDQSTYNIVTGFRQGFQGQRIESPVVLDLLPIGFEYVANSSNIVINKSNFSYDDESTSGKYAPEVIPDYKNTGRTALLWKLSSFTYKLDNTSSAALNAYSITYKTVVTKLAKDGSNTNEGYLAWKNTDDIKPYSDTGVDDIYDINENGDTSEKISMTSVTVNYRAAAELIVTKEAKGSADNGYVYNENSEAPTSAHIEIGSDGSYRLRALNNSLNAINHFRILDVLPYVGDKTVGKNEQGIPYDRGSQFPVKLKSAITLQPGYTAYYSLDESEGQDYDTFYESVTWETQVDDYTKVKAIKIEMNSDQILDVGQMFEAEIPVTIDKNYDFQDTLLSNNSFGVSTNEPDSTRLYFESNNAPMQIIRYKISGHVFDDRDHTGLLSEESPGLKNKVVTLVDQDGQPVKNLEGQVITTTTDNKGYYEMESLRHGQYRIQVERPEGYEVSEPKPGDNHSQISLDGDENLTDVFALNDRNKIVIRNAGYFKNERQINLFKYDAETLVDSNNNNKIDAIERKNATPLEGADFEIYEGTEVDINKKILDDDGEPLILHTTREGTANFTGQLGEEFTLVEVKAPNGYELIKKPIVVKNVESWNDPELWIYVANHKQTTLPDAGGENYFKGILVLFSTFSLIGLTTIGYIWLSNQKQVKKRRKSR